MLIQSLLFSIMRLHLINQRVVIFTSRVFQNTRKNTHACIGVLLSWSFQTWRECYRMICPKNLWRELLQFFFPHSNVVVILAKAIWFTYSSTLTACQEPGRLSKKISRVLRKEKVLRIHWNQTSNDLVMKASGFALLKVVRLYQENEYSFTQREYTSVIKNNNKIYSHYSHALLLYTKAQNFGTQQDGFWRISLVEQSHFQA